MTMRYTFILLFLCLFSCKKSNNTDKFRTYTSHSINMLEDSIYLPQKFIATGIEEHIKRIEAYDKSDTLSIFNYKNLKNVQESGVKVDLFFNKKNIKNTIALIESQKMDLNKKMALDYANYLQMHKFPEDQEILGVKSKILEKEFYPLSFAEAIKVKFSREKDTSLFYFDQYMISYRGKAFALIVRDNELNEYDDILKSFGEKHN